MKMARIWSVGTILLVIVAASAYETFGQAATLTVVASSDEGTAPMQFVIPLDGEKVVTQNISKTELTDPDTGSLIGTLEDLTVTFNTDPVVQFGFAFKAGASDTTFSLSSGTLNFAPLVNPTAAATGTLTLVSNDGGSATGQFPGDKAFEASYNGGTVFAQLVDPLSLPGFGATTANETSPIPQGTFATISGSVSSMEGNFDVLVTANELITGTGQFQVIPEPASLALMALGVLAVVKRRRASH